MVSEKCTSRNSERGGQTVAQVQTCTRVQWEQKQRFNLELCMEKHCFVTQVTSPCESEAGEESEA